LEPETQDEIVQLGRTIPHMHGTAQRRHPLPPEKDFAAGQYVHITPHPSELEDEAGYDVSGWIVPASSRQPDAYFDSEVGWVYKVAGEQTGQEKYVSIKRLTKSEEIVSHESFEAMVDKVLVN
jgi:hypothetical protein